MDPESVIGTPGIHSGWDGSPSQDTIHSHTQNHSNQGAIYIGHSIYRHILGSWEETKEPGRNPQRHGEQHVHRHESKHRINLGTLEVWRGIKGIRGSVVKDLGDWLEGCGFDSQHCQATTVESLRKILNAYLLIWILRLCIKDSA